MADDDNDRYENHAQDPDKYRAMKKAFRRTTTPEQLTNWMMLYVLDNSYPRPDISRAVDTVKREKGWT